MARFWYSYNGVGDPFLTTSYNQSLVKPTCINGPRICAIYSPGATNPTSPLSTRLRTYISNIFVALTAQPESNVKKYVYARPCSL